MGFECDGRVPNKSYLPQPIPRHRVALLWAIPDLRAPQELARGMQSFRCMVDLFQPKGVNPLKPRGCFDGFASGELLKGLLLVGLRVPSIRMLGLRIWWLGASKA